MAKRPDEIGKRLRLVRSWYFHGEAADFFHSAARTDEELIAFDALARKLDADPFSHSSPRLRNGEIAARLAEFAGCMMLFRFDASHAPNGRLLVLVIRKKS